ncbi:MAG: YesL family protein [Firmicutes bacterium]|nr:YesL family protein [Bacillota bacterium]
MKKKESGGAFPGEGKIVGLLNKSGEIILLNMTFLLCCLPVVTVGPALSSLYYATMKSIRRERGYPVREFFFSLKRTLKKGILLTLLAVLWLGCLFFGRYYAKTGQWKASPGPGLYDAFIIVSVCVLTYIFPVLSRFEMKLTGILKLSFLMCIRFLPVTVLSLAGTVAVVLLMIFVLPIPCILFVPGLWCLALTYLLERALQAYTPEAEPGEEQWFDKEVDKEL